MSIKWKILILSIVLLSTQFTIFFINNHFFSKIYDNEKIMTEKYIEDLKNISVFSSDFMKIKKAIAEYIAFNKEDLKKEAEENMMKLINNISNLNLDNKMNPEKEAVIKDMERYLNLLKKYNSPNELKIDINNFENIGSNAINSLNKLQELIDKRTKNIIENNELYIAKAKEFGVIIIIIAMILGIVISIFLIHIISKVLKILMNYAQKLSEKDYTVKIPEIKSNDEFGKLIKIFKEMHIQSINDMKKIKMESNTLTNSMNEIAQEMHISSESLVDVTNSVNKISEEMENITAAIEETTASVQEISSATKLIADNATEAAQFGHESTEEAEEAGNTVKKSIDKMVEITETTNEIEKVINEFNESAIKIKDFVDTVTNIAEQTNLLALNAAIEAARAGDAGKGFAVVADEIRVLAEESRKAADEIREVVEGVQSVSDEAMAVSNIINEKVKEGSELANEAGDNLEKILKSIKDITARLESIAASVEEQTAAVDEIATAMTELSENTTNINASIQEINAATEEQTANVENVTAEVNEVKELANRLMNIVNQFKFE